MKLIKEGPAGFSLRKKVKTVVIGRRGLTGKMVKRKLFPPEDLLSPRNYHTYTDDGFTCSNLAVKAVAIVPKRVIYGTYTLICIEPQSLRCLPDEFTAKSLNEILTDQKKLMMWQRELGINSRQYRLRPCFQADVIDLVRLARLPKVHSKDTRVTVFCAPPLRFCEIDYYFQMTSDPLIAGHVNLGLCAIVREHVINGSISVVLRLDRI